eukprot:CAMPEP_0197179690 /NCGR_PEP_ID=MMETSP1423-20130617/4554_1 /TAXON_ID=476441 /ORGANISM="Pseudo-nitzschia heimii, Strain UNC1101" /LENGTH=46 /DNA_ID= /DNA_START= /DNA_END= /DNA_ORIENTATION=
MPYVPTACTRTRTEATLRKGEEDGSNSSSGELLKVIWNANVFAFKD